MKKKNQKQINIGDTVRFVDEFGRRLVGEVISLAPYGYKENGVGINTPDGYGCYCRQPEDVVKLVEA